MPVTFSIICPTFNSEKSLKELLDSINYQSHTHFEVIIVDGASTDHTLEIAKSYPRIKIISEPDFGIYDAMNKGIKMASGDWLLFMGSDDHLYSSSVLETIAKETVNHQLDLIYGHVLMGEKQNILYYPRFNKKLYFLNSIHHQGVFYNKRVFENFQYNIDYKISADYELNLKLLIEKANAKYCNCIISVIGDFGLSSKVLKRGYLEEILIRNKLLCDTKLRSLASLATYIRFYIKKYTSCFLKNSHLAHRFQF